MPLATQVWLENPVRSLLEGFLLKSEILPPPGNVVATVRICKAMSTPVKALGGDGDAVFSAGVTVASEIVESKRGLERPGAFPRDTWSPLQGHLMQFRLALWLLQLGLMGVCLLGVVRAACQYSYLTISPKPSYYISRCSLTIRANTKLLNFEFFLLCQVIYRIGSCILPLFGQSCRYLGRLKSTTVVSTFSCTSFKPLIYNGLQW